MDEKLVAIDELALDRECIRLPSDFLKVSTRVAEFRRDMEEAKRSLEVVQADVSRKIRANPGTYGLEKVTEAAIGEVLLKNNDIHNAQVELADVKHKLEMEQALLSALETKKKSVAMLVELHGMGWFSSPKVSERGKAAVGEMTKRATRRGIERV